MGRAARDGRDVAHYELLNGRILMTAPAGYPHGSAGARLTALVVGYLATTGSGRAFDASQGFDLPSGDTVEPDLSVALSGAGTGARPLHRGRPLDLIPV